MKKEVKEKELKAGELNEVEKAQAVLNKAEQEKQEAFAKEINAVCEKHGYALDVVSQITIKKVK